MIWFRRFIKDTVVPQVVVKRSANVDEIELVITVFVNKGCDNAAIAVTDDRCVVSDCADGLISVAVTSRSALMKRSGGECEPLRVFSPSMASTEWYERVSS